MPNNIIDSIQVSGVTYQLSGSSSGGNNVVELTQAEYDALVDKDPTAFYIITDATAGDLTQYWTSAQTNSAINAAVSGKQDTLSAGTNITISGNVISAEGGKAVVAGRGISITTGEIADIVSFNLPISAGTGTNSIREGSPFNVASAQESHAEGHNTTASTLYSHAEGVGTLVKGRYSHAEGHDTTAQTETTHTEGYKAYGNAYCSHAEGSNTNTNGFYSHAEGYYTKTNNESEHASGAYNVSNTGSTTSAQTLFSVGNGTSNSARHNAFEIRKNGDIYLSLNGQDVKLQDQLGGGSITVDTALDSGSTNAVANSAITTAIEVVSGAIPTTTSAVTSGSTDVVESGAVYDQLGGLKLVKLTQSAYDALSPNYDSNTLYVIVN